MKLQIKEKLASEILKVFPEGLTRTQLMALFEKPKNEKHGHLSMPVFFLAATLKKAPPIIAKDLCEKISELGITFLDEVTSVSGFINFKFKSHFLADELEQFIKAGAIGLTKKGEAKKMVIDYGSPNVAKPMNVGHLRASVIGQALRNLAESQGYEVVGLNHLGDWGVQFGKLVWAYQNWKQDYDFENQPFKSLFNIYVRFHAEAEKNPELNEFGAAKFRELEAGDPEILEIWKLFVDMSLVEYDKIWARLGVKHDLVRGESFYSDQLDDLIDKIKEAGLLEKSEGAFVVSMDDDRPPCLIQKSDGASLYATRDLASAIYRKEVLGCDLNVYVTGVDQKLHFSQVFTVLEKMNYDWVSECSHIMFGMYRFKDSGKMSTRKGRAIFLEDILNQSVEKVKGIIQEKNPDLKNIEEVAEIVGVGAIIFNDLANDRIKDVDFEWDKILNFSGNSGPYVQYTAVRCKSIMRKSTIPVPERFPSMPQFEEAELDLVLRLLNYETTLGEAFKHSKPNYVAAYLLELCQSYNSFYNKCKVLSDDPRLTQKRLYLVDATQKVITEGLKILNIKTPEQM